MSYQGIYAIINLVHGGAYIGSSTNVFQRYDGHISDLKRGNHCNGHLQKAWNEYGEDNFELGLMEEIFRVEDLLEAEQYYINLYGHYNIALVAGRPPTRKGIPLEEIKPGWCDSLKATFTEERRKNLSELRKANPQWHAKLIAASKDPEVKARAIAASQEACKADSYKKKISEFSKAHPEYIAKATKAAALANKGRKRSEETSAKIGEANKSAHEQKKRSDLTSRENGLQES